MGSLREGLAWHRNLPRLEKAGPKSGRTKRRTGDNLLLRLHRFKDDVLRFLIDFKVPFTNNLAEQALRMMKVKMKISGGFRTEASSRSLRVIARWLAPMSVVNNITDTGTASVAASPDNRTYLPIRTPERSGVLSGVERPQVEMLLDPAHARLKLADHAVANDRGVVVDHRATKSHNLLVKLRVFSISAVELLTFQAVSRFADPERISRKQKPRRANVGADG